MIARSRLTRYRDFRSICSLKLIRGLKFVIDRQWLAGKEKVLIERFSLGKRFRWDISFASSTLRRPTVAISGRFVEIENEAVRYQSLGVAY